MNIIKYYPYSSAFNYLHPDLIKGLKCLVLNNLVYFTWSYILLETSRIYLYLKETEGYNGF